MLVLKRRLMETLVIGEGEDAIKVRVTRISHDWVNLAVDAPQHVPILREELLGEPETIDEADGIGLS